MRLSKILWLAAVLHLTLPAGAFAGGPQSNSYNQLILEVIDKAPSGGGYSTKLKAHSNLANSVKEGRVNLVTARPSYCSGATYLVFLKVLQELENQGQLDLSEEDWTALQPKLRPDGQDTLPDGTGIWGRWNANGPGTARLFYLLGAGKSFTELQEAKPGDFLKIFWNGKVGKEERGHLVVFLGGEEREGEPGIRYWSSNQPDGMGEAWAPLSRCKELLFTRLEKPSAVKRWETLPEKDPYLSQLLRKKSSWKEALEKSGIKNS